MTTRPPPALPPLLHVTAVEPRPGFLLRLTFENGEVRRYSMVSLLARGGPVFRPLREVAAFNQVFVANGRVGWPNGADLDPELLYQQSVPERQDDLEDDQLKDWDAMPEVGLEVWPAYEGKESSDQPADRRGISHVAIPLLSVVQLKPSLVGCLGTVVELLDEETALVEFADKQGLAVEMLALPVGALEVLVLDQTIPSK